MTNITALAIRAMIVTAFGIATMTANRLFITATKIAITITFNTKAKPFRNTKNNISKVKSRQYISKNP